MRRASLRQEHVSALLDVLRYQVAVPVRITYWYGSEQDVRFPGVGAGEISSVGQKIGGEYRSSGLIHGNDQVQCRWQGTCVWVEEAGAAVDEHLEGRYARV